MNFEWYDFQMPISGFYNIYDWKYRTIDMLISTNTKSPYDYPNKNKNHKQMSTW